jgi:hypothetical protein
MAETSACETILSARLTLQSATTHLEKKTQWRWKTRALTLIGSRHGGEALGSTREDAGRESQIPDGKKPA